MRSNHENPVEAAWYYVAQFQMPLGYEDAVARLAAELAVNEQKSKEAQDRCLTDDARKLIAASYERRADLIRKTLAWAEANRTELAAECERDVQDAMQELGNGIHDECDDLERKIEREREEKERMDRRRRDQALRDAGTLPPLDEDENDIAWSDSREPLVRFVVPEGDWPHLNVWDYASRSLPELREKVEAAEAEAEKNKAPSGKCAAGKANSGKVKRAEQLLATAREARAALEWAEGGGAARYPLPQGINPDDTCPADLATAEGAMRGLARRFLIQTPKGAVEVRVNATDYCYAQEEAGWYTLHVELFGESVSDSGYRSCGHQAEFADIAPDPYGWCERMVREIQENARRKPKNGRGRVVVEEPEEPSDEDVQTIEDEDEQHRAEGIEDDEPPVQQGLFA